MFSDEQNGRNFFRRIDMVNNQNFNEVRDFDSSGPLKTILRPVPMVRAKYMLIDWVNPIRAIYFPLAHQAGPGYEDLCVYLMIDFRLRQGVEVLHPRSGTYLSLNFDRELGLDYRHLYVMSFDLKGIYDYLILPQQLRAPEKGLYRTEPRGDALITMWGHDEPTSRAPSFLNRPFLREIDLVSVINNNFGVDVTWQPYQYSSWVVNFLTHVIELGLGFIPVIGPLMSVSFSVGLQIITDPDAFRSENILHLSADIIAALISGGMDVRDNLPRSHQRAGAKIIVIRGLPEEELVPLEQEAKDKEKQISEEEAKVKEGQTLEEAEDVGKEPEKQEAKNESAEVPEQEAEDAEKQASEEEAKVEENQTLVEVEDASTEPEAQKAKDQGATGPEQDSEDGRAKTLEQGAEDVGKEPEGQKAKDEEAKVPEQEVEVAGKQPDKLEAKDEGAKSPQAADVEKEPEEQESEHEGAKTLEQKAEDGEEQNE